MAKKLSILDKTFQLALLLHRRTAEFNRKYKFTIGDRIDVVAEEAQEMILRANHQTDPKRAAQIIYDFVLRIDTLSLKLRMAVALGLMSDDAKAQCDMLIAKIKDEARGWRNYFLRGEGCRRQEQRAVGREPIIIILKRVCILSFIVIPTMQKTGEYNSNNAFIYNGNTGNVNNNNKYNTNAVRPVSEFQGNVDPFASFYKSMRAAYRLCLKNKAHTANAIRFWLDEESELVALAREVFNCEYVPRQSIAFIVTKPCLREVVAADFRDRIVQHYIVMRLEALFEECGTLDDNMFSCRVGKGNLAAIQALQQQIFHQSKGYTTDCYVAKFDLQSFFMSIDKRRLYDELVALVAKRYEGWDKDTLLYLIRVVTLHNPQDNAVRKTPLCDWADLPRSKSLYNVDWFLGLAIGNLTSQSDANFYNAPAMRWMRSVGLAPVNYVDDFAFVVRDKASFLTAMPYIRNYFAAERGLTMHPRKFYLQHYSKGIKFLGAVIKYNRVYTNNQTVARCFGKIHYYNEACRHSSRRKARHVEKLATILNSYLGLMRHFDTFNIRKRIAAEVGTVWCDYIRFDDDITTATVVKHFRQREICKYNVRKQRRRDLFTLKNLLNDGNTAAN